MRQLSLTFGLLLFSFYFSTLKSSDFIQDKLPNYTVALKFINDYTSYYNSPNSTLSVTEWVGMRLDVTNSFREELQNVLQEAYSNEPEFGLGFDPIVNAQDLPEQFKIKKTDNEYVLVEGVHLEHFQVILKLKFQENEWIVDGSGIINIPRDKQIVP